MAYPAGVTVVTLTLGTTLQADDWDEVGGLVEATGPVTILTHPGGSGDPRRFYRAKVVP